MGFDRHSPRNNRQSRMSALGHAAPPSNVRFTPKSGHWNSAAQCPLCAKSGRRTATRDTHDAPVVTAWPDNKKRSPTLLLPTHDVDSHKLII